MNTINTNMLTSNQFHDVQNLISLCKDFDHTSGISFLDAHMNEYPDFPCFFLGYEGSTLVSFLSVFIPNCEECDIYSYTLIGYREKGYFHTLFQMALEKIRDYNIPNIYFVVEPKCFSGVQSLIQLGATLKSSEYQLRFNEKYSIKPSHILELTVNRNGSHGFFSTSKQGESIGSCHVDYSFGSATIYGFEIEETKRGQTYGKEQLLLILEYLIQKGNHTILLHVSSNNPHAYHLYMHNGFTHDTQIDYWQYS